MARLAPPLHDLALTVLTTVIARLTAKSGRFFFTGIDG
jgi:hypothetical protein